MGIIGDQVKGMVASAVVASAMPDEVHAVKDAVGDMLGENMKAAAGLTTIAASIAINMIRDKSESE